jgi:ribonuclease HI
MSTGLRPTRVADIQTDGSFSRGNISRTAVILHTTDLEEYKLMNTYFDHKNSGESEWCSILNGLRYAIKKDQGSVELENDCLPVIQQLIHRKEPRKEYLAYYYISILKEIKQMDYVSVRWIPREFNRADELFRLAF